jgi:hypothetical protein
VMNLRAMAVVAGSHLCRTSRTGQSACGANHWRRRHRCRVISDRTSNRRPMTSPVHCASTSSTYLCSRGRRNSRQKGKV